MTGGRSIAAVLLAALALSACGKSAELRPPDGEAAAYSYPRVYPKPSSVLPAGTADTKLKSREIPVGAGNLSPIPNSRKKTTYGDPGVQ